MVLAGRRSAHASLLHPARTGTLHPTSPRRHTDGRPEAIHTRRSIRAYQDKPVPEDLIQQNPDGGQ